MGWKCRDSGWTKGRLAGWMDGWIMDKRRKRGRKEVTDASIHRYYWSYQLICNDQWSLYNLKILWSLMFYKYHLIWLFSFNKLRPRSAIVPVTRIIEQIAQNLVAQKNEHLFCSWICSWTGLNGSISSLLLLALAERERELKGLVLYSSQDSLIYWTVKWGLWSFSI